MEDREVERRGETIGRMVGAGAHERALGRRSLAAHEQDLAERVPQGASALYRGAATSHAFGLVVFSDRRVCANQVSLRIDPLTVGAGNLGENRDRLLVLARTQRLAAVVDVLGGKRGAN